MSAVTASTNKLWPGIPVIPAMDTGATDGIYLIRAGIPTYGVSGIFNDEDDYRAHGRMNGFWSRASTTPSISSTTW